MRLRTGEDEGTDWRVERVSRVVQRLRDAAPRRAGRPSDRGRGRGGAAESTLAERRAAMEPASEVVHTDDIAWTTRFFDWAA